MFARSLYARKPWENCLNHASLSRAHSGRRCLFGRGAPLAPAQTVMKLANATINDVQHEWQKLFAAELQKRVGDKVKTEIYPASQLGAIPRMVEGVLLGTIESFITPTAFLAPTDPRFQIFDVPGLFVSPEHVHAVIHDPAYRDHLETMFLDRGLRIIGAIYNSPTVVLTKKPSPTHRSVEGHEGAHLCFAPADRADEGDRRDPGSARADRSHPAAPVRRASTACSPACRSSPRSNITTWRNTSPT